MDQQATYNPIARSRGTTLIEVLLVISVLVIVLSLSMPSMNGTTAKADMTAAVERVEQSIELARNTARLDSSGIALGFKTSAGQPGHVISFRPAGDDAGAELPEFHLPSEMELVTDQAAFLFDESGAVRNPGRVILVSRLDETMSETITVK